MRRQAKGFTLLETMIALVVLGIAALGALAGMIAASDNIRRGQSRQYRTALVEARTQQLLLLDKSQFLAPSQLASLLGPVGTYPSAGACTVTPCTPDEVPIGAAPWTLDPTGAFFSVTESGITTPITAASIGNPANCADAVIPKGTICREVALLPKLPGNIDPPSGSTAYTFWVRVVRVGDPSPGGDPTAYAVADREVVVE